MDCVYANMKRDDLKKLLKEEIKNITLQELYEISYKFNEDIKYLPREYKKQYRESVLKVIINRFTSLKNTQVKYEGNITKKEAREINELLLDKKSNLVKHTLNIIVIYATYLERESVHMPGTEFPGMLSVYTDGVDYYCPVKKYHINSSEAVCKYCIAKEADV